MAKQSYKYTVLSKIDDTSMPLKFKKAFSDLRKGQTISTELIFEQNRQYLLENYKTETRAKNNIGSIMKKLHVQKSIQRIDDKFIPEWFESLRTISYWQSQLRGSRLKNSDSKDSTRSQYLYHLWNFQKWLSTKTFEINTLHAGNNDMFVRKTEKVNFKNVEELLNLLEQPFADSKNIIRIVKQYLLDECNKKNKASYVTIIKAAIVSYFEKNEQEIRVPFNPKTTYSTENQIEQSMSISDVMEFLTTGKPSVMEKTLFLCKFHRGLDVSTLVDRFNYEAWGQIAKWFGSENHNSWDLDKCPVPIILTRVKTDFKHVGFLERDAITELQRYLAYRQKKTGKAMNNTDPLFLNKLQKPISIYWTINSFAKIAKRAGIQESTEWNGRKQYKMDSHELRDLLKSTLIDSGCRIDVADHVIGHKPKDSYEKQSTLYPETLRKEYAKASARLNIFTKFSNVVSGTDDSDTLKAELHEKMQEISKIKEDLLDKAVINKRQEIFSQTQQEQMRELQDTVNELKKEIRQTRQDQKKALEFCCAECSTIHDKSECPACGSKLKRIYEEKISR